MNGLSKSRYTDFCQCPKNLWMNVFKYNEAVVDPAVEARLKQGSKVGVLARGLFGSFVDVTTKNPDDSLDLTAMVDLTQKEMARGTNNICEASFALDDNYCAVDILRRNGDGWDIYEVKDSSYSLVTGKPSEIEVYAPDIAYQKWLMVKCGIKVVNTYLVCLNSDYVRHGAMNLNELFVIVDMKVLVDNEYLKVTDRIREATQVLACKQEPYVDLSMNCHEPYNCAFFDYCKRQHGVPFPSVFNLYGGMGRGSFTFRKKLDYYHRGQISFEQLRGQLIGPIQDMQIESTLTGKKFINPSGIREFLDKLYYPLYFLDFETMQDAVPQYDDAKVYAQIPFQYSLHIKPSDTAPYDHKEYLAPSDGKDPRQALAKQLCLDIPMDVCTVAYNKQFECGRIRELAMLYPDLSDHLQNIADHIVDLIDPFRAGDYYVPAMGGSFSIKSVLPALFPDDTELNYHNLDERCQNGGDAMNLFPRIKNMPQAEAKACREALLDYCKLDTWAMVKVWEKLREMAKN